MTQYFLRSNAVAEPLVNHWYAWPLLISPATAALVTVHAHMNILRSYIRMPKMHEKAVNDPKMRGGPFMDFQGKNRVEEVKQFLVVTESHPLHELAKSIEVLNTFLLQAADGHSMGPLYADIPHNLQGYVELVYDTYHRPHYRLLENLLYRSNYYDTALQSMMLSTIHNDAERSFVLSTPRLSVENQLEWKIPFFSKEIDTFFKGRRHPVEQAQLVRFFNNHFEDTQTNQALFFNLFTEKPPAFNPALSSYQGEGVRIRYFGHACVLIETKQTAILIDAMVSYGYPTNLPRFTDEELPEQIDYVLLTHAHQDHVLLEHLLPLRHRIKHLVVPKNASGMIQDPSLKLMFKALQFNDVIELDEMESIGLPGGEILGIPFFGEHGDLYIQSKMAYVLRLQGKVFLFAADSDNIEPHLYEHLQREIPRFDMMFLGMECEGAPASWLYGSLFAAPLSRTMDQSRRLNGSDCERAMDIIRRFACPEIYIYAMGMEPWLGYITSIEYSETSRPLTESNQLIETCKKEGRRAERLYLKKEIII